MLSPPDQFQRRVRVRLPLADPYLAGEPNAVRDIADCFARPLLHVTIAKEAAEKANAEGNAAVPEDAKTDAPPKG